ncbi:hypothetical protein KXW88_003989 [Aspergillus fumigatus]|nr:hypothetical protein KXW88_003989 [Aspergillus fumigatus]
MAQSTSQTAGEPLERLHGEAQGVRRREKKRRRPYMRDEYAQAILSYSQQSVTRSLYAGVHFENLARYLQQPYEAQVPDLVANKHDANIDPVFNFVTFYNLDPSTEIRETYISSPDVFESKAKELADSPYGRLIFMRGHPSPEWLLTIGATYQVDPEFFRRHLDFRHGLRDHYSLPSLPSTLSTALTLRVATIGASVAKTKTDSEQDTIEILREENKLRLNEYREKLKSLTQMKLGDSIVRDLSIHDLQQFSIEQDISLYVGTCGAGWFALIWLDTTSNWKEGATSFLTSPLRTGSWMIFSVPVIQHRAGLALRQPRKLRERAAEEADTDGPKPSERMVQSACLLHLDYGLDLDKALAAGNSFYALHEILVFAAFSENQFLNMLETKLLNELDPTFLVHQKNPTLSNLLYHQRILDRHIQRIKDNLAAFKGNGSLGWPRSALEPGKQRIVDDVAETLIGDYEYLLSRSLTLSGQCSRGMQVVMNNAMIKESRDAMSQAEGVVKLTRLAFIFVPLTFTASFFGMNFAQFGQGHLSLWICPRRDPRPKSISVAEAMNMYKAMSQGNTDALRATAEPGVNNPAPS